MFGSNGPLFEYRPKLLNSVTFYFHHLSGEEQEAYRESYFDFEKVHNLMLQVFRDRLSLYRVDPFDEYYAWPEEKQEQDSVIKVIPEDVILESGAAVLGWMRTENENSEEFINRIVRDIENSLVQKR